MEKFLSQLIYPHPLLLIGIMVMIFLDLLSGIRKASKNGEATSSRGLRNSFDKATTYFSLNLAVLVIVNITNITDKERHFVDWLSYSTNTLLIACCYVELKSILENLIEINSEIIKLKFNNPPKKVPNDFAKLILIPIHNAIILKFKKQNNDS